MTCLSRRSSAWILFLRAWDRGVGGGPPCAEYACNRRFNSQQRENGVPRYTVLQRRSSPRRRSHRGRRAIFRFGRDPLDLTQPLSPLARAGQDSLAPTPSASPRAHGCHAVNLIRLAREWECRAGARVNGLGFPILSGLARWAYAAYLIYITTHWMALMLNSRLLCRALCVVCGLLGIRISCIL
jgi:hypothetical protein